MKADKYKSINQLRIDIKKCNECSLREFMNKHQPPLQKLVGIGSLKPDILFVTEAPSSKYDPTKPKMAGGGVTGIYYSGGSRRFYEILSKFGLIKELPLDLLDEVSSSQDARKRFLMALKTELKKSRIYFTDIVKCPNMDKTEAYSGAITFSTQKENCSRWLKEEISILEPKLLCFNGKEVAESFFNRDDVEYGIGEPVKFVLPSTSPSAKKYWNDKYWELLAKMKLNFD